MSFTKTWEYKDKHTGNPLTFIKCEDCNWSFPVKYGSCKKCGSQIPSQTPKEDSNAFAPVNESEERMVRMEKMLSNIIVTVNTIKGMLEEKYLKDDFK